MEITWTKTKTIVTLGLLLIAGLAWGIDKIYFPSVDERFFQLDYQRLRNAPANVFILRPTHHGDSKRTGCISASASYDPNKYKPRFVGRNATVADLITAAYQCQPSRMALPPDMPTNRFDLLDTLDRQPAERFQNKIKSKFGYFASWQQRDTDILLLKVSVPNAPGLHISNDGPGRVQFNSGRLCFTHMKVGQLVGFVEGALRKPVEDRTDLTDFYDFSIPWGWKGFDGIDADKVKSMLADLGLSLDDDSDSMRMMVVEHVR